MTLRPARKALILTLPSKTNLLAAMMNYFDKVSREPKGVSRRRGLHNGPSHFRVGHFRPACRRLQRLFHFHGHLNTLQTRTFVCLDETVIDYEHGDQKQTFIRTPLWNLIWNWSLFTQCECKRLRKLTEPRLFRHHKGPTWGQYCLTVGTSNQQNVGLMRNLSD